MDWIFSLGEVEEIYNHSSPTFTGIESVDNPKYVTVEFTNGLMITLENEKVLLW